ncbi:hypothetical protein CASFOL_040759 [Castilleja foliolosa]|uniref:Uncharacterized protein n=1 Tax=Castilleja foliolosa TaxID=1961234 RepID=A0ABD3BCH6_9LAMI
MTEHSFTYNNKLQNFDVWVMQDYEADDSWVRCFSVEGVCGVARSLQYVAFMEDKLQVLLQDGWGFYLHDVRTSSVRRLVIEGLSEIVSDEKGIHVIVLAQVVPESIFRLHDNCGVGGRKRIVVDKEESVQMMSDKVNLFCRRCDKMEDFLSFKDFDNWGYPDSVELHYEGQGAFMNCL